MHSLRRRIISPRLTPRRIHVSAPLHDRVGPPHPVSNIRPMVYEEADPAASSHSQSTCPDYHPYSLHEFEPGPSRPFRLQWKLDREQTDRFHHEFWLESNTRFEQGKREALDQLSASASAIEKERALSEFYRVWHEREHLRTDAYTKEWRDRNKTSVTLATRVAWHTLVTRILGLLPFETSKTNKGRA